MPVADQRPAAVAVPVSHRCRRRGLVVAVESASLSCCRLSSPSSSRRVFATESSSPSPLMSSRRRTSTQSAVESSSSQSAIESMSHAVAVPSSRRRAPSQIVPESISHVVTEFASPSRSNCFGSEQSVHEKIAKQCAYSQKHNRLVLVDPGLNLTNACLLGQDNCDGIAKRTRENEERRRKKSLPARVTRPIPLPPHL